MTDEWEQVERGRELLLGGYEVQWTPSRVTSSGARTMPYPAYDDVLMKALWAAQHIVGKDYDYLASYEHIREVPLGVASASELSTWSRGESGFRTVTSRTTSNRANCSCYWSG